MFMVFVLMPTHIRTYTFPGDALILQWMILNAYHQPFETIAAFYQLHPDRILYNLLSFVAGSFFSPLSLIWTWPYFVKMI